MQLGIRGDVFALHRRKLLSLSYITSTVTNQGASIAAQLSERFHVLQELLIRLYAIVECIVACGFEQLGRAALYGLRGLCHAAIELQFLIYFGLWKFRPSQ